MDNEKADLEKVQKKQKTLELKREIKTELADYRRPFEPQWKEYDDAYYGKQHKTSEDKKTVKNHIFKVIEGEVPILTDSMPGTQVDAELAERQVDADILQKAIRYVYQDQNLPLILPTLVRSSLQSAPGWLYVSYNPDANGGEGKIEYRQLDWKNVFVDGNAQTIEQAERAVIEIPMRRSVVARMWPELKDEIMRTNPSDKSGVDNVANETRDIEGGSKEMGRPQQAKGKDICLYSETWVKSYDLEPIPEEDTQAEIAEERAQFMAQEVPSVGKWENHDAHDADHAAQRAELLAQLNLPGDAPIEAVSQVIDELLQTNPEAQDLANILLTVKMIDNHREEHTELKKLNPSGEREKYKDGWRVLKFYEDVELYDGPNPDEKNGIGHIPLVPFYAYKDNTIYGFGEIKNILCSQHTLNDVDQREIEGLRVSSNPGWRVDKEAKVDHNQLTNEPGIVIEAHKGTTVERLNPGQVSQQLDVRRKNDMFEIEQISGINEATQGNLPSGGASGVTVQKLQTQAIGRIRLKDRYLQHYSMRRLAVITGHLILIHWTDEKNFRLRGDDQQLEDVVFEPIAMQDLGYSISISPGSMAGLDKDALNAFYLQLFAQSGGAMTFEDLLSVLDFPKREMLLVKIQERMKEQQGAEEIQAQLVELQSQNASLLGLVNPGLLDSEQKKVFEIASKQALIEKLAPSINQAQQPGVNSDQPVEQGI
jgi:hypothetical protein